MKPSLAQLAASTRTEQEARAMAAGWEKKEFARGVFKWWNPKRDEGSRYIDSTSGIRHLCEDHNLA